MRSGEELGVTLCNTIVWSSPKDQQNKADEPTSVNSAMYVIVHYCKEKDKVL